MANMGVCGNHFTLDPSRSTDIPAMTAANYTTSYDAATITFFRDEEY